jgi:hypothetical protein
LRRIAIHPFAGLGSPFSGERVASSVEVAIVRSPG